MYVISISIPFRQENQYDNYSSLRDRGVKTHAESRIEYTAGAEAKQTAGVILIRAKYLGAMPTATATRRCGSMFIENALKALFTGYVQNYTVLPASQTVGQIREIPQ